MLHYERFHNFEDFLPTVSFFIFFVLIGFKNDVKGTFQVISSPFRQAINFREDIWINVLKNCLILRQVISQLDVIFIALFQKICYYSGDLWLEHIFPIKVKKKYFLYKYACKIFVAYTLSKAYKSSRAYFDHTNFCQVKMDLDSL